MRRSNCSVPVLLSTLLIPVSLSCSAQVVDVTACRAIADSLQRFACYEALGTETVAPAQEITRETNREAISETISKTDPEPDNVQSAREEPEQKRSLLGRLFDREPATAAKQEPPAPPVAEATAATAQSRQVASFGRNVEPAAARVIEGTDGKSELIDTVASLKEIGPKVWLVTLKSGQRWRQLSGRQFSLKVGDQVTIYAAGWGNSYRLSSDGAPGFIQVERVD